MSVNSEGPYTIHGIGYTSEEEFPGKTQKEFLDEFLQSSEKKGIIDCQIIEDLFLALAALRDDSDENQWFVLDTDWGSVNYPESIIPKGTFIQCLVDKWNVDVLEDGSPNPISSRNIPAHKATVEELIEYFNK